MSDEKPQDKPVATAPLSPWKLTPGRIVILILGVLLVLYTVSAMMGGLSNYQQLREASTPGATPAQPEPAPAN